jgi:plasmid stabilization system protein ParE
MSYPLRFNKQTHEEYIAAYQWYELEHTGLGDRFMNCVEKRLQQISEHPQYYSSKQHPRYREVKVEQFPYMIVYEFFPRKRFIHIAAIYHSKRNTGHKYRRLK